MGTKRAALVRAAGRIARKNGFAAYLVGGCVRDDILKHEVKDLDIVVEGDARQVGRELARDIHGHLTAYPQFLTATVVSPDGLRLDLATARSEVYLFPGALPQVRPGSIRQDLFRRDFTVNAIAATILPGRFGEVTDFFGGVEDLAQENIRILHDNSFVDDPTRILRAIRFEQRFEFRIEPQTLELLRAALRSGAERRVKPQRYFAEFKKIFKEASPACALRRAHALGALNFLGDALCPDLAWFSRFEHRILCLREDRFFRDRDWASVFLMAFFHGARPQSLQKMVERFGLSRDERKNLISAGAALGIAAKLGGRNLRPSDVHDLLNPLSAETILFIRAATSVKIVGQRVDDFSKIYSRKRLSITGDDLKRCGLEDGRETGRILKETLAAKINGALATRREELDYAKSLILH
ncbi:MAG: hypothetical protein U1D99_04630 [Candidatus Omnitrophota bacterium]|nr:hypothetical protein [Candidatus Omnitrophota bacterium]